MITKRSQPSTDVIDTGRKLEEIFQKRAKSTRSARQSLGGLWRTKRKSHWADRL